MSRAPEPTILIIVGITGDLAKRKLLPAVEAMAAAGVLPEQFRIIGITRRNVSADEVLTDISETSFLRAHLQMHTMDLVDSGAYRELKHYLETVEQEFKKPAQRLFYLSIPPQVSYPVVELLGASGLSRVPHTKLLVEKPFGTDLASAEELIAETTKHFNEAQIYRIDHYLAKEMTQNIMVFRGANTLFKETWNNQFIASIDIVAAEKIDIEGRAAFYEQAGALRDVVQSHLLQLAALMLIPSHTIKSPSDIPKERAIALSQLVIDDTQAPVRAQYEGYQDEVNNPGSQVETFVAIVLKSNDPAWQGVPLRLVTGKALHEKTTEIRLTYKSTDEQGANQLILRIQPKEGVDFCIWAKAPGYERRLQELPLKFTYQDHYQSLPEAYEQVLLSAVNSDHSMFTSSEEVFQAWRVLEPLLQHWAMEQGSLRLYKKGSKLEDVLNT